MQLATLNGPAVTMTSREIAELTGKRRDALKQYLYVCEFSNGLVKVGRSVRPKTRISAHIDRLDCAGIGLTRHHIIECSGDVLQAEAALITWCKEAASAQNKNEWFYGVAFESVVTEATRQAGRDYPLVPRRTKTRNEEAVARAWEQFDAMFPVERSEMSDAFLVAKVARDIATLNVSNPGNEFIPREEFGGISEFELLAGILIHENSSRTVATLFCEAAEAAKDPSTCFWLVEKMRASVRKVSIDAGISKPLPADAWGEIYGIDLQELFATAQGA